MKKKWKGMMFNEMKRSAVKRNQRKAGHPFPKAACS
jgi:hypothetical protein